MQNESPFEFEYDGDELTQCDNCFTFIPLKEIEIKGLSVVCKDCYNKIPEKSTFKKERIEYGTDSK